MGTRTRGRETEGGGGSFFMKKYARTLCVAGCNNGKEMGGD
jgi:hypothetical protein